MQRLLADAEALTGVKYDINNLGDVYSAIHVIQGELGLTGVAAAEAEGTFTGSFASMKAAAQNFLGELALGMDLSDSLNVLTTSATTFFFNNFLPMLGNVLKALPGAIIALARQGIPMLLSNVSTLITKLASSISTKANSVTSTKVQEWLKTTLPKIVSSGGKVILTFAGSLIKNLPKIVVAVGKIGLAIIKGLGSAIWGKITAAANGIRDRFLAPINAMRDKVKGIIDKIKGFFPIKIGRILSNLQLPHFNISGKFSLNPPSMPKVSVDWYEKGGIFNGATVLSGVGLGEAGPEAIMPLTPFWRKMDKMTDAVLHGSGNTTINVYAAPGMDIDALASKVEHKLIQSQNRRRLAWQ